MSASLAAVPTTVCTTPEATSTPICAFIPKCHWLPFLVWCISGSRALLLFFVEGGAAMMVARCRQSRASPGYRRPRPPVPRRPAHTTAAKSRSAASAPTQQRPAPLALRIERPQTIDQPPPRHHLLHLAKNLSRRVCFFFPAYSACEKLHCRCIVLPLGPPSRCRFYPIRPAEMRVFFSVSLALRSSCTRARPAQAHYR